MSLDSMTERYHCCCLPLVRPKTLRLATPEFDERAIRAADRIRLGQRDGGDAAIGLGSLSGVAAKKIRDLTRRVVFEKSVMPPAPFRDAAVLKGIHL